jgi:hypothetical protein
MKVTVTAGLTALLLVLVVQAQGLKDAATDAIPLELGANSASMLDDTSPQNFKDGSRFATFKLDLSKGGVTELRLTSDFDGYLTLYGPSLELLQSNDDADDSDGNADTYESAVVSEVAESGTYLAVVSGYNAEAVGAFELAAKDIPVVDDSALALPTSLDAVLNDSDEIDNDARYFDTFTLELAEPATVTFSMGSDIVDSYLKVFDADGSLVNENDDKVFVDDPATTDIDESTDFSLNAELELDLPAGSYTVQALSYSTGFYQLSAQSAGGAVTTPTVTPSKPGAKPGAKPGN